MLLRAESPTSRRSLRDIFVEWVTLGLHLFLVAASRGIGVCQNILTWLVQHATCHGSGYGNSMIGNGDGPFVVVITNSKGVKDESLRSFLKGSPLKMHNVFNMLEGKWITADYYDITENDHEIIPEQPISENGWIHCRAEIDDYQSSTGYQSIRSFNESIRKNRMVPPGDASTLMSACEDELSLPESCMQWILLNCIAMLAIYELQMINLRHIQDPEIKTDTRGSSLTNVVNCETGFTSKEPCVSSCGVGFELKNQSDLKNRNQGETWLSESYTNVIKDTDTSNVPRKPRNSDIHRQEDENGYHLATVIPRHGKTLQCLWNITSEVINNVSEMDSNVNRDGKHEDLDNLADGMDEASVTTVSDKKEGSSRHAGGKGEGSEIVEVSDSQAFLPQNNIGVHIDGKPERSDLQVDVKLELSKMQVDSQLGSSDMQNYGGTERSDMQIDGKPELSKMQADSNPERSDVHVDGKLGGLDLHLYGNPERLDIQVDGNLGGSGKQVDSKPECLGMKVGGQPEGSDMQAGAISETDVYTLTEAGQIPTMQSGAKKPKRQRKRAQCCITDRIKSCVLWKYKPKLLSSLYRYRDRRKRIFANQRKRPQPQKFRGSKNIPVSISEETAFFVSTTDSLPRSSHTSSYFETNRQTEGAYFKGQGHTPCAGNPKACTDFVDALLYKAGDNLETIKLKEKLKFLLRPDQQLCELKTVKGLAMHCFPKMERWEIQRLMESERKGLRHETCVDHVIQELIAHGLKVGHVVQYFSQQDSRRHDVVRVIEKIHGDCKFCTCLYNDDDFD